MKPTKNAVALVIKNGQGEFLVVRRPDDEQGPLAGVWGFPAVTLKEGETEIEAAQRVGATKLGIDLAIEGKIGDKTTDRGEYILHLSDYSARPAEGQTPSVPQADTSMTQYVKLKYTSDPSVLFPAAQKGSLCSQVYLQSIDVRWDV